MGLKEDWKVLEEKPKVKQRLIYSKRNKIAKKVEEWCYTNNASECPLNVITALDSLGYWIEKKG